MTFQVVVQAAMQFGVIPALALFLVYQLHHQNRRLTDMIDRQERETARILTIIIDSLVKEKARKNSEVSDA
jgi:regulator of PEP synthase PpsR (kinase-PPPase family)